MIIKERKRNAETIYRHLYIGEAHRIKHGERNTNQDLRKQTMYRMRGNLLGRNDSLGWFTCMHLLCESLG